MDVGVVVVVAVDVVPLKADVPAEVRNGLLVVAVRLAVGGLGH